LPQPGNAASRRLPEEEAVAGPLQARRDALMNPIKRLASRTDLKSEPFQVAGAHAYLLNKLANIQHKPCGYSLTGQAFSLPDRREVWGRLELDTGSRRPSGCQKGRAPENAIFINMPIPMRRLLCKPDETLFPE
jgi:hypothetical protein